MARRPSQLLRGGAHVDQRTQVGGPVDQVVEAFAEDGPLLGGDRPASRRVRGTRFHQRQLQPDEYTELVYESIEFDLDVPDSTFTLQALKP